MMIEGTVTVEKFSVFFFLSLYPAVIIIIFIIIGGTSSVVALLAGCWRKLGGARRSFEES